MSETNNQDNDTATAEAAVSGFGGLLVSGLILAIGFLVLFDTAHHLLALYNGSPNSPVEIWVRVFITAVLGSTCVVASLSTVTR